MSHIGSNGHTTINQTIAEFLKHSPPLDYTGDIELAWQSLTGLQDAGYGFSITSLGRENLQVRIIRWGGGSYADTATGEYIVNVVDHPPSVAICKAVVRAIAEEGLSAV